MPGKSPKSFVIEMLQSCRVNFCHRAGIRIPLRIAAEISVNPGQIFSRRRFTSYLVHSNELSMTTYPATQARELLTMSSAGVSSVEECTSAIKELLAKAQEIKPDGGLEPALTTQDFDGGIEEIGKHNGASNKEYAAIETACRNIFYALLVRLSKLAIKFNR